MSADRATPNAPLRRCAGDSSSPHIAANESSVFEMTFYSRSLFVFVTSCCHVFNKDLMVILDTTQLLSRSQMFREADWI